jgi:hypothetical protein
MDDTTKEYASKLEAGVKTDLARLDLTDVQMTAFTHALAWFMDSPVQRRGILSSRTRGRALHRVLASGKCHGVADCT